MLVFIGTIHTHPNGHEILANIYDSIVTCFGGIPEFVAVEGTLQMAVLGQQGEDHVAAALASLYDLSSEQADQIARSFYYEPRFLADLDHANKVWLCDGESDLENDTPRGQAEYFAKRFGRALGDRLYTETGRLAAYCNGSLDICWGGELEFMATNSIERERRMVASLRSAMKIHWQGEQDYGVVVLGANHLTSRPWTLFSACAEVRRYRTWCLSAWADHIDEWLATPSEPKGRY